MNARKSDSKRVKRSRSKKPDLRGKKEQGEEKFYTVDYGNYKPVWELQRDKRLRKIVDDAPEILLTPTMRWYGDVFYPAYTAWIKKLQGYVSQL